LKYIVIFLIPIFIGCQTGNSSYEVLTKSKTVEKGDCKVPVDYPQINGERDTANLNKINEILEKLPEHEYYAHDCTSDNPQLASGKFEVLLKTDSVLCIEYQTDIEYKNEHRTIFHSLVINPNKDASIDFGLIGIEPSDLIPNFDRGKILPYIKKYNSDNKDNINLLAYEKGSNYVITWGITESHFIIYPGGEGEWFGYDKIEIPLDEL
jgi:hypothetical protein